MTDLSDSRSGRRFTLLLEFLRACGFRDETHFPMLLELKSCVVLLVLSSLFLVMTSCTVWDLC